MAEKHFFGKVAVKAVIVKDGKVLICRDARNADMWEIPGGRINEGEKLEEALKREIIEELGVPIRVVGLVNSEQSLHVRDNAMILFLSFETMIEGSSEPSLPPSGEIAEIKWIGRTEAAEHKFYPDSINAIGAYFEIQGK
jgi:8-oxo-dGTP pyrophosphatase MutT (NUDIX family)